MNDAEEQLRREVALFRYGLIANLVRLPPGTPGIQDRLCAKAEHQYIIPGTLRTRVATETLRYWLLHYRRGGFDALYPKPRGDRGQPRRLLWGAASIDVGSPSASASGSSSMPSRYSRRSPPNSSRQRAIG